MLKKNDIHTIEILDISSEGSGVGRIDNFIVFIEGAVHGDICEIKIVKVKKTYAYGIILKIVEKSKFRVPVECAVFKKCGGCTLQHLDYKEQLVLKQDKVEASLKRIGNIEDVDVMPTVGTEPCHYRNKVQIPVGSQNGKIEMGFYAKNSHDIVSFDQCLIQPEINGDILKIIKGHMKKYNISAYSEREHTGCVRHIFIRAGHITKEIMVCIVVKGKSSDVLTNKEELIQKLNEVSNITSILLNYNNEKTNVIMGEKIEVLFGKNYIEDYIDDIKFKISAKSFYQINSVQTEKLYKNVVEFLSPSKDDIVLDAYCGIGTISLFLAKHVKKVYGVEVVKDAIDNAIENSEINNILNSEFIVGRAEEVIPKKFKRYDLDMIVLDPPRKGCHEDLLKSVLDISPKKIVYVSCDPATLARDLKTLCQENYEINKITPYDFFPHTMHVESIVLLTKKNN